MTSTTLPPGLIFVHGNRPEELRELLVAWIQRQPLDPLESEIILVQSNGIAQWLKLALAEDEADGGCGIAAALDIQLPSRFLWQVYRAVLGRDAVPEVSPFDKSRLVWRLMRLLPELANDPCYAPLSRFLEEDGDRRKRFQLAERLADLYDQYQVYRADWLAAWAGGENVLIDARGLARPLAADQLWQAGLWRALLADVSEPAAEVAPSAGGGRAAVHAAFLERAAAWGAGAKPSGLPRRLMVFGISSLPRQSLEILEVVSRWTQIVVCVHNPCEHYWADILPDRDLLRAQSNRQRRRAGGPELISDDMLHQHAHPLLAAWGKQGRDFIGLLDEYDSESQRARYAAYVAALQRRIDLFSSPGEDTLLRQLQDDIRDLRPLHETRARWPPVEPGQDASLRFHVAHSPQREVEILHDQLLEAFNRDRTLRPRDVIVMVPDIDVYAPHVQAVFGLLDRGDPRHIPFSLADQGRRQVDPLLKALESLLGLPRSRLPVSEVLDLLEVPALRRRFGIEDDDLPLLHRWIRGANIRWGLHGAHRASLGLPGGEHRPAQNTWLFGLRRMLLGYALGPAAEPWREIEPYDEIGGIDAALLGPLVQLLERLDGAWRTLSEPATVEVWCQRLSSMLRDFFDGGDGADAFTLLQLETGLLQWQVACEEAALREPLPLSVVGDYWLSQLEERGLSQRFFAGAVTFATLMPMRAIPFRRVCLLGMNDGAYPRARTPMDFDLMGRDYRPGDRSRREDDRYLFLEALLSARDHLHVSWVGRSVTDNSPRPPSVLVGQLRDHLGAGWRLAGTEGRSGAGDEALLAALTLEHRLQPFSRDYFPPSADGALFTYAHEWRPQSGQVITDSAERLAPPIREEPLGLDDLAEFLRDPVKAFFRGRLGVHFESELSASEDAEPFALDGLRRWQLQHELIGVQLEAMAAGGDVASARDRTLARIGRRGELAAGEFGTLMAEVLAAPMEALFERYRQALARWPEAVSGLEEIRFRLAGVGPDLELADVLGGIRLDGEGRRGRVLVEPSDLVKDRHYQGEKLIRHWIAHLASHLAGQSLTTVVISKVGEVELQPLEISRAESLVRDLMGAWRDGMSRPLPLAAKTAFAWLRLFPPGVHAGDGSEESVSALAKALGTAQKIYESRGKPLGELWTSPYLQRVYPSFRDLFADGEFAVLAETLYRPLQQSTYVEPGGQP